MIAKASIIGLQVLQIYYLFPMPIQKATEPQTLSQKKLYQIKLEQKDTAHKFQLSNFLQNGKVNLQVLKANIHHFKKRRLKNVYSANSSQLIKNQNRFYHRRLDIPYLDRNGIRRKAHNSNEPYSLQKGEHSEDVYQDSHLNQGRVENILSRRNCRSNTGNTKMKYMSRQNKPKQVLNGEHIFHSKSKTNAVCPLKFGQDKATGQRVRQHIQNLQNITEFRKYQSNILMLYELYQLLTQIMIATQQQPFKKTLAMVKYVREICNQKYQFISQILDEDHRRVVATSWVLEALSIFYLALELSICSSVSNSNIVNYFGYCTSNLIFLIRLMTITHDSSRFQSSPQIADILLTIQEFELQSYGQNIRSIRQCLLYMGHNNQILLIMQNKLLSKHPLNIRDTILKYLRNMPNRIHPFYYHCRFVFQFLAYSIHHHQIGLYLLDMAPPPYLRLQLAQTIIIDPNILIYNHHYDVYIRAYARTFIKQISQDFNVVLWSTQMPVKIDIQLDLLKAPSKNVYRLYRYHCKRIYNQRSRKKHPIFIRVIENIGNNPIEQCLLLTSNELEDSPYTLNLAWRGQKRDTVLWSLTNILHQYKQQQRKTQTLSEFVLQLWSNKQKNSSKNFKERMASNRPYQQGASKCFIKSRLKLHSDSNSDYSLDKSNVNQKRTKLGKRRLNQGLIEQG